jgi:hypothetical protein
MRPSHVGFRTAAALTAFAVLLGSTPQLRAQGAAQPTNDAPVPDAVDPPAVVGRVARVSGTVSYHGDGQTDWEPAGLNLPVTSGSGFWTEPGSGADLDIPGARIVIDGGTDFEIQSLDEHALVASAGQGSVYVRVRSLEPGETITLRTPRGTVTIGQPGGYVVSAGDTQNPTLVTASDGQAQVSGPGVSALVGPHQTLTITGAENFAGQIGPEQLPAFARAEPRPQPIPRGPSAPPQAVAQMTGGDALYDTGRWEPSQDYGQVWYPPVQAGWVPYRQGHWGYVAPWGWTWIDDAPWGFAPFHYGRWVEVGPRWAWVPVLPGYAVVSRPVYAPALVAFIGLGVGIGVGMAIGRGPVGWVPLGPREVYRPPYRVSNNYIRNVNVTNVTNVTNINNTPVNNANFINRRGATQVPASAMTGSQPVGRVAQPISAQSFASARPLTQVPVTPSRATVGVTPTAARQLGLPPAAPGTARPVAPGPAVRPVTAGTPQLAPPGGRPVQGGAPRFQGAPQGGQPQGGQPQAALPALRPQGQAPTRPPVPTVTTPGLAQPGGAAPQRAQPPGQAAAPRPAGPSPVTQAPVTQAPVTQAPQGGQRALPPLAPQGGQRPAIAQPGAAPQAQPRPAVPQPQAPVPQAPVPQAQAPQPNRAVPQAQPQAAAPRPPVAAAPQPNRAAPAVQAPRQAPPQAAAVPRPAPPQQHAAPPPVQHAAPPPPAQHAAPAPQAAPQHNSRACPPNRPNC